MMKNSPVKTNPKLKSLSPELVEVLKMLHALETRDVETSAKAS